MEDDTANALVRLAVSTDVEFLPGGDGTADVRLDIRGILVGVSLGNPDVELSSEAVKSRLSFKVCELLLPVVPTEGDPAIVGS